MGETNNYFYSVYSGDVNLSGDTVYWIVAVRTYLYVAWVSSDVALRVSACVCM